MATKTKAKPKPRRTGSADDRDKKIPSIPQSRPTEPGLRGEGRDLAIDQVVPSKLNSRRTFDEAKLNELAATIRTVGLLQPVLVRPLAGQRRRAKREERYELVVGERRYRAAVIAGLKKIPAVIRQLDDAEALEVGVLENLQREDLNAIEEAEAFRMLLVAGSQRSEGKLTQEALAVRLGVSQPHVANRLRLLGLPAAWRKKIISGEITASQARCLVPLADRPKFLAAVERCLKRWPHRRRKLTTEGFEEVVESEIFRHTRPVAEKRFDYETRLGRMVDTFTPTDQQREQLELIEVPGEEGAPEQRACNVKLWEKLQKAYIDELVKREAGKKEKKEGSGKKAAKLSAAEKKRLAEEKRQRARERARVFKRRLADWKIDWLRWLIAGRLVKPDEVPVDTAVRLLVYFVSRPGWDWQKESELAALLRDRHVKVPQKDGQRDVWTGLAELPNSDHVLEVACRLLAGWFWDLKEGPRKIVPAADCEAIAEWLCIDLAKAWKAEQRSDQAEAYYNLHTVDQLKGLAGELKLKLNGSASKAELVGQFTGSRRPLPMPKEILKAKA